MTNFKYADIYVNTPLDKSFLYKIPENIIVKLGYRVHVNFAGRNLVGYVTSVHNEKVGDFEVKEITSVIDQEPIFDQRLVDIVKYISYSYISSMGEAFSKALPSNKKVKDFPPLENQPSLNSNHLLTDEQELVYSDILNSEKFAHLLYGITGSGKTEVYIKLAANTINSGKSVIFLVPEIGLSSQIYTRLKEVFADQLVLYHSLLNLNERYENWLRFYRGEAKIVIGTRSSVFMQCPDLGLIIIDEEQDGSYKEQSTPRYSAKRVAFYRAMSENAKLLLGSATPAIETFYAAKNDTMGLHVLDKRFGESELPEIEFVEVDGKKDEISSRLKLFTNKAVRRGKQAVFLLNRRGFSPVVMCSDCSEVITCPHCSIGMNYHKNKGLICHYCGHVTAIPKLCGSCGSESIVFIGSGTQKIEEIILDEFPDFNVLRMDQDSSKRKNAASDLVSKMNSGEIDILLGTQMISKGFDFPNVIVAGILMADIGMNLPDFRSSERIFSLLVQLSGRSGRSDEKGKVIIQTLNKDHNIFKYVKNQDYTGFYDFEIEMRRALNYPPFSRLARLVIRGKSEEQVESAADELYDHIDNIVTQKQLKVEVLGPSPAPLSKVGGNYRHHIILKTGSLKELPPLIRYSLSRIKRKDIYVEVDIDPVDMI